MPTAEELKARAAAHVESLMPSLLEVSHQVWNWAEIGLQEVKSSALLCETLAQHGFQVERGIAGLPTAFRADRGALRSPVVAILAEYDALPGVGHGCGHNIICSAAVGAALGLSAVEADLPGSYLVLGTPAEESAVENAGGKVHLLDAGAFQGVDAAIMVHPGTRNSAALGHSLAARSFEFEFFGKAAHAAGSPHLGINALDGVIQTFNGINALRQHVRSDVRIHGIITHGGASPNIVPDYAACRFRVRASDAAYLEEAVGKVIGCAEGAARASGSRFQYREVVQPYHDMVPNHTLDRLAAANMMALGLEQDPEDPNRSPGSTDMGNVSHVLPACHPHLRIADPGTPGHSVEMRTAAGSPSGDRAVVAGAKLLAWMAIDLLTDPDLLREAQREHARTFGA
ncbi:MAG: M20 family metallopeptidase [Chloroflexi bacterium]|nr:M20 family metallopeptidase [Chloroflexota bacterium]